MSDTTLLALQRRQVECAVIRLQRLAYRVENIEYGTGAEHPRVLVVPTQFTTTVLLGDLVEVSGPNGDPCRVGEVRLCNCRVQWRLN